MITFRTQLLFVSLFLVVIEKCEVAVAACLNASYNSIDYKYCYNSVTKVTGQSQCASMSMELAVISTDEEFFYWQDYFRSNYPMNEVWLAATFSQAENAFVWDTGGQVPSLYLGNNSISAVADGDCLKIYTDQWLMPVGCDSMHGFLCQGDNGIFTTEALECRCSCDPATQPKNESVWEDEIDKLVTAIYEDLLLDKESLSSTKRKHYCIGDNRISARSVGYMGVLTLILSALAIVWMDLSHISSFFRSLKVFTFKPKLT